MKNEQWMANNQVHVHVTHHVAQIEYWLHHKSLWHYVW